MICKFGDECFLVILNITNELRDFCPDSKISLIHKVAPLMNNYQDVRRIGALIKLQPISSF